MIKGLLKRARLIQLLLRNKSGKLTNPEKQVVIGCSVSSALEFYNFVIYVFFAKNFAYLFFPVQDRFASLMTFFSVFAIGYLVRPLGGLLFSHFGDTLGRKNMLVLSALLTTLSTFLIGFLPIYQNVGILATILLVILRLLQGLSLGGEIPGSVTFAAEHMTVKRRCFTLSLLIFGYLMGILIASFVRTILDSILTYQQMCDWGWRIPFLLSLPLGILIYYLRIKLNETPVFETFKSNMEISRIPLRQILQFHISQVIQGTFFVSLGAVAVNLIFLYMPTYLYTIFEYAPKDISVLNTINLVFFGCALIFMGWLSDLIGKKTFMLFGSIGFIVFSYPLLWLMSFKSLGLLFLSLGSFSILSACIWGPITAALIELFPTPVRYTGVSISYNIAFAVFGGLTPIIATFLLQKMKDPFSPAYYLILIALCCSIATLSIKDQQELSFV